MYGCGDHVVENAWVFSLGWCTGVVWCGDHVVGNAWVFRLGWCTGVVTMSWKMREWSIWISARVLWPCRGDRCGSVQSLWWRPGEWHVWWVFRDSYAVMIKSSAVSLSVCEIMESCAVALSVCLSEWRTWGHWEERKGTEPLFALRTVDWWVGRHPSQLPPPAPWTSPGGAATFSVCFTGLAPCKDWQLNKPHVSCKDWQLNKTHVSCKDGQLNKPHAWCKDWQLNKPHASCKDWHLNKPHAWCKDWQLNKPHASCKDWQLNKPHASCKDWQLNKPDSNRWFKTSCIHSHSLRIAV